VSAPFQAALLGVVQGVTEFLPVSSTAHLLIGERLLGFQDPGSVFTEMIQLGSILAILWLYRARVVALVRGLLAQPEARRFALMLIVAAAPALAVGAVAADYIESVLHQSPLVIGTAFVGGGVVMLIVERFVTRPRVVRIDDTSIGQAAGIGVFQTLALIPGVSRSGATIVGARVMGLDRATAAEFSFFLAMPTMAAVFAHKLLELRHAITTDRLGDIAIGFVMAFISSALVVKPFLGYVTRNGFGGFAWYRILAGLVLFAAVAGGFR
jgi:undecaprenyl-diphosphatase